MDKTIKSIIDIIKSCDDLQLCTFGLDAHPETRTIMNGMNKCIESIDLHFLTMKSSPKFQQLENNNNCCLYYFNPTTRYAVRLFGKLESVDNQKEKNKYWQDKYSNFGFSGATDPNFALLHFIPELYKFYIGDKLYTGKIKQ